MYYSFVKKFDLADHSLTVLPKDGEGRNIRPENLVLADLHRKANRVHERHRIKNMCVTSYKQYLETGSERSRIVNCRQITQYTRQGVKMRTFPSTAAAARFLDLQEIGINSVLKDRQVSHGVLYGGMAGPRK